MRKLFEKILIPPGLNNWARRGFISDSFCCTNPVHWQI